MRIPAGDIEGLVLDRLRAFFSSRTEISDALAPLDLDAQTLDAALRNAFKLSERWFVAPPDEIGASSGTLSSGRLWRPIGSKSG